MDVRNELVPRDHHPGLTQHALLQVLVAEQRHRVGGQATRPENAAQRRGGHHRLVVEGVDGIESRFAATVQRVHTGVDAGCVVNEDHPGLARQRQSDVLGLPSHQDGHIELVSATGLDRLQRLMVDADHQQS
jgi:hypothetical protein